MTNDEDRMSKRMVTLKRSANNPKMALLRSQKAAKNND